MANYKYILGNDAFKLSIYNTFFITFFQLLVAVPIGFLIALTINSLARGKNFLKALFFIPYVTPAIAAGTLFLFVLHPNGILNTFLSIFGIPSVSWLSSGTSARFGAVLLSIWRSLGFNVIIFLAYLQTISPEYYEAAYIDGCTRWATFWKIVFPLLKPTIATVAIIDAMAFWNDYLLPSLVLQKKEEYLRILMKQLWPIIEEKLICIQELLYL